MLLRPLSVALLATGSLVAMSMPASAVPSVHGLGRPSGSEPPRAAPVHFTKTLQAAVPPPTAMSYHGGPVLAAPQVYVVFWGSEWQSGFSSCAVPLPVLGSLVGPCYSSGQVQSYIASLLSGWGGSAWRNTDTQYCQGIGAGQQSCDAGGLHIVNPVNQFGGSWIDTSTVPGTPSQQDVANEAQNAINHFRPGARGADPSNLYYVFTPPGKLVPGSGVDFCGYHSAYTYSDGSIAFAFAYEPYIFNTPPCGKNFVNTSNDSFGHGYMDGLSMVIGHEVAEAETDPGAGTGWTDATGGAGENGDKCNFSPGSRNVALGANYFAMQPLWSNLDPDVNPGGSCVLSSAASLAHAQRFISNAYVDLLSRGPDQGGLNYFSGRVFRGAPRHEVAGTLTGSIEYRTTLVNGLYQRYLGRAGDSAGVNGWVSALGGTATDEGIAAAFIGSPEYFARHGGNNTGYIHAFYHDVLGRAPDAGAAYWVDQLNRGLRTRAAVASEFMGSVEFRTNVVNGIFAKYLGRGSDAGGVRYWVDQLGRGYRDEALIASFVGSDEYFTRTSS